MARANAEENQECWISSTSRMHMASSGGLKQESIQMWQRDVQGRKRPLGF